MKYLRVMIASMVLCSSVVQAECQNNISASIDEDNYTQITGGVVKDNINRLIWMRCAIGQTWNQTTGRCSGDAQPMNWQQALQLAHGYVFNQQTGWRLPNMKELNTIVERQCVRPAINEDLFPDTPADDFWTSTPSMTDPTKSWVVAFFNGSNATKTQTLYPFVRLVKTAD